MDWTDSGAVVSYEGNTNIPLACPRCGASVAAGTEHRCGDQEKKPKARKRKDAAPK